MIGNIFSLCTFIEPFCILLLFYFLDNKEHANPYNLEIYDRMSYG